MAVTTSVLDLHLLTGTGVMKYRTTPDLRRSELVATGLNEENIRSILPDPFNPRHLYACSVTDVYTSDDAGETWQWLPAGGVDYREIWCMAVHPTRPNELYLGTMPAMVYVSENGGRSFRELASFRDIPDYTKWCFPVPPHAPNARWITLDARVPDEILVGVEEGGVVRSRDRGATWEDISGPPSDAVYPKEIDPEFRVRPEPGQRVEGRVYRDVHRILRDPTSLERIYVTTGFGLFITEDSGRWWNRPDYGLDRGYAVPMAFHPDVPHRLFLGAGEAGPGVWPGYRYARTGPFNSPRSTPDRSAETGGARSAVLRSDDGGESWRRLQGGLPQSRPEMVSGVVVNPADPDNLFVTYTDGKVYASADAGESWELLLEVRDRLYGIVVASS
jgi:hypothetical protein